MSLNLANWKWACIAAVFLTGLAMLVVFGFHPGGFESQGALLFVLLPGAVARYPLSDLFYQQAPHAEPITLRALIIGFNFFCYRGSSSIVIKILRAAWHGF